MSLAGQYSSQGYVLLRNCSRQVTRHRALPGVSMQLQAKKGELLALAWHKLPETCLADWGGA